MKCIGFPFSHPSDHKSRNDSEAGVGEREMIYEYNKTTPAMEEGYVSVPVLYRKEKESQLNLAGTTVTIG